MRLGVAAALLTSVALSNAIQGLLFEVRLVNPAIMAATSFALAFVSAVACVLPAWRGVSGSRGQVSI